MTARNGVIRDEKSRTENKQSLEVYKDEKLIYIHLTRI